MVQMMASMSRYAEEDSNQKYLQLCCSVRFSTRPKIAFSHIKIKGNGGFFFRCGTTRKHPSWSKRWTPRRGFSSSTGPTLAGSSSWRHTQTSKRGLKRWRTKSFIKSAVKAPPDQKSLLFTPLGPVRRCQAALDGPVQILGTDLFSCVLVGVLLDLLHLCLLRTEYLCV